MARPQCDTPLVCICIGVTLSSNILFLPDFCYKIWATVYDGPNLGATKLGPIVAQIWAILHGALAKSFNYMTINHFERSVINLDW
jgi:hypothetical protein